MIAPGYSLIIANPMDFSTIMTKIDCNEYDNVLEFKVFEFVIANEYVGDVTIPTQIIKYNQCFSSQISQSDCSIHIKLNYYTIP
jgi:hypothetical protein